MEGLRSPASIPGSTQLECLVHLLHRDILLGVRGWMQWKITIWTWASNPKGYPERLCEWATWSNYAFMLENSDISWAGIRGHLKVYTLTKMEIKMWLQERKRFGIESRENFFRLAGKELTVSATTALWPTWGSNRAPDSFINRELETQEQ